MQSWLDTRQHPEHAMRTISLFAGQRHARLGAPSRLPTIVPTRSSMLRRLLWAFGVGR
jgi:hypothetical protein